MWRRKPTNSAHRYELTSTSRGRRKQRTTSRAPWSSAVAALSNAEAPAPSTATRLPRERRKVDRLVRVRVAGTRQVVADHRRDLPLARAVDAGRQHHPAREQRVAVPSEIAPGPPAARASVHGTSQAASAALQRSAPTRVSARTGMSSVRRYQARYAAQVSFGMSPSVSQLPGPCCASYQARGVRLGMPRSGPVRYFGVRSVRMRAKLSHGPARSERVLVDDQQVGRPSRATGRTQPPAPPAPPRR